MIERLQSNYQGATSVCVRDRNTVFTIKFSFPKKLRFRIFIAPSWSFHEKNAKNNYLNRKENKGTGIESENIRNLRTNKVSTCQTFTYYTHYCVT